MIFLLKWKVFGSLGPGFVISEKKYIYILGVAHHGDPFLHKLDQKIIEF